MLVAREDSCAEVAVKAKAGELHQATLATARVRSSASASLTLLHEHFVVCICSHAWVTYDPLPDAKRAQ